MENLPWHGIKADIDSRISTEAFLKMWGIDWNVDGMPETVSVQIVWVKNEDVFTFIEEVIDNH
jgi:hypothetical protein